MQVTTFSKREQVTQAVLTLVMAKVGVPLKHSLEFMFQVFTFIIIDVVPFYPLNLSLKGCLYLCIQDFSSGKSPKLASFPNLDSHRQVIGAFVLLEMKN